MPPTFRDAIIVTRRLGISYIWIDSICIVQDDADEWKEQSAKMGSIFENSCCTIAAVDALENKQREDEGLFMGREDDSLAVHLNIPFDRKVATDVISRVPSLQGYPCVWKYQWLLSPSSFSRAGDLSAAEVKSAALAQSVIVLRPRILSNYFRIGRSTWAQRGWVMQERFLSRRIIYYTKDKLYWDSLEVSGDEEHAQPSAPPIRAMGNSSQLHDQKRREVWEWLVHEYSNTVLTYNRDKLTALVGLADSFTTRYRSQNYGGIDADETGFGLLWHGDRTYLERYPDFHAPSWTWAAYKGSISYYCATGFGVQQPLAGEIRYEFNLSCPFRGQNTHLQDDFCGTGSVLLDAPIGLIYPSGRLLYGDPSLQTNAELLPIIGQCIHMEKPPIPRYTSEGAMEIIFRELSLPKHTEILLDARGKCIG